ncbi:MAG: NTF2-like N-terminal transpeptidase domain-containing protein [Nitriliruptor sp.]
MRQALAGLAALLVVAAAVFIAVRALDTPRPDAASEAVGAESTIDEYLDAWSAGDHEAMVTLVRGAPEGFVAAHDHLREGLDLRSLTAEATEVVEDVDGRAAATVAVSAEVPVVGAIEWEVELQLLRERGAWGVAWEPSMLHPAWRPGLRFVTSTTEEARAPILAADGTPLAGPGERVTFGVEPGAVDDVDEVVAAYEAAIPGSGASAARVLGRSGLVDGWFYPVTSLSAEAAREAARDLIGIAGILRRNEDGARSLLADDFAVHVVGRTGEATAEDLERLGEPYEPGDVVGRTGLERALEPRLADTAIVRVELRDGETGPVRETLATASAEGGDAVGPLRTTLDVTVQRAIENSLVGRDTPAAMVVVAVADGAIRGSASRPIDGFNRAFEGRYPPGTALGAVPLDALASSDDGAAAEVDCPQEVIAAGRRVVNPSGVELDRLALTEAIAGGCATSLATVGADLDAAALVASARRFGADQELDLPLPATGLSFPEPVDAGAAAVAAAGQGLVEVSPLHLATVAAAASTGEWFPPYLLEDAAGQATTLAPGALDATRRLLSGRELAEGLTGYEAAADGLEGAVHAWFLGVVDELAVVVLIEDGEDESAGALAERFARELRALADAPVDAER